MCRRYPDLQPCPAQLSNANYKIDPPVYYESEKEFVYAKLRAIHVADMGGSIMGGHGGQEEKLRITKLLSNGRSCNNDERAVEH